MRPDLASMPSFAILGIIVLISNMTGKEFQWKCSILSDYLYICKH